MRKLVLVFLGAGFWILSAPLIGQNIIVTLPAAASIVGAAPFFSDVRAFNTSYTNSLNVTATYRCFLAGAGGSCSAGNPVSNLVLAPRQSMALNDIVAQTFGAPNTAGGVEFSHNGQSGQLVVTSRLFSTVPTPTVGMFIPGLDPSTATAISVLTSVRNGGAGAGFRTNVGLFNPGDSNVSVTFQIFDGSGAAMGSPVAVANGVGGHSGAQINNIFGQAGVPSSSTDDAVVVVNASAPVLSYAAVIDNNTTDPYLVVGAPDVPSVATHSTHLVHVGPNGQLTFVDDQSGNGITTINVGDTVNWVWETAGMNHGVDSGRCSAGGGYYGGGGCTPDGNFSLGIHTAPYSATHTFNSAGAFPYFCDVHMGAMTGRIVVQTPSASVQIARRAATR